MSRLFAYMGNDQDRVKCALYPARKSLVADGAAKEAFDAYHERTRTRKPNCSGVPSRRPSRSTSTRS